MFSWPYVWSIVSHAEFPGESEYAFLSCSNSAVVEKIIHFNGNQANLCKILGITKTLITSLLFDLDMQMIHQIEGNYVL